MSTPASDKNFNFSPPEKNQQSQNIPNLTDVDPIGKTWEKHRINADKVAEYYAKASDETFNCL
ncbi:MAG: hypothetical protein HEQ29_06750 [Dolichospermum sp. LBC05a]|nr:hypothetical protein [Dolichospermum sp. OL01]MCO5796486.1 hypothetical protein [Dolichospermum sp. OL03]MCS6282812.1 hypothetical protein [Dolichospermum sp.]QSV58089.1 MAG: hypothetical protein HEQ29_06750 [Dolichospermum sp. LBC05a]QSV62447.1 MAG: hypothetical protein HEQ26_06435 [Dolichospermum sp. DL01]